jgi:hypothetical protein
VTNIDRRLAKVEEAVDPTGIVLRWLAEAHAYGDMAAYARAMLDDPHAAARRASPAGQAGGNGPCPRSSP